MIVVKVIAADLMGHKTENFKSSKESNRKIIGETIDCEIDEVKTATPFRSRETEKIK